MQTSTSNFITTNIRPLDLNHYKVACKNWITEWYIAFKKWLCNRISNSMYLRAMEESRMAFYQFCYSMFHFFAGYFNLCEKDASGLSPCTFWLSQAIFPLRLFNALENYEFPEFKSRRPRIARAKPNFKILGRRIEYWNWFLLYWFNALCKLNQKFLFQLRISFIS